jgi:hypothetical protein
MRLIVRRVVESLATYPNRDDLFRNYPDLEPDDVQQALAFAAANLEDSAATRLLEYSNEQRATIVTLNTDFHPMVVLSVFEADLEIGAPVTVKGHKTTCHQLPVGGSY